MLNYPTCFWLLFILIVFCILLLRYILVIIVVHQESMSPTIKSGDRLLAIRFWPKSWVKIGQIVIVSVGPDNALFVKRVVALAGDTYQGYIVAKVGEENIDYVMNKWSVPSGYIFVCGDNINASTDSRQWGSLPLSSLRGLVFLRLPK